MRRSLQIGLFIALLAGCSSGGRDPEPTATRAEFVGEVWRWTGLRGAEPAVVDHPARYTIEFLEDGRYAVRADCNSGSGAWSTRDGVLSISGGPMTMVACGEESHDSRYLELLGQVTSFSRDGAALTPGAGPVTMVFEAMPAVGLAGTTWLVRAVNNGRGAVASVVQGSELTISSARTVGYTAARGATSSPARSRSSSKP